MTALATRLAGPGRLRHREPVFCAVLAAATAVAFVLLGPAPGDAPVHLYRTFLVEHGDLVWDNSWYAGTFPLASYSLLYYFPAALVGNVPLVIAGCVGATLLFASVTRHEWDDASLWPSRIFAIGAATPLFTGLYSYSLGLAALLGTIAALQQQRRPFALALAAVTLGFSPLAFGFLVCILASAFVGRRGRGRSALAVGIGLSGIAGFQAVVLHVFPTPGVYPFALIDLVFLLGVCGLGALVTRRAAAAGPLLAFFGLWAVGGVILFAFPNPIGGNWARLREVIFPVMLLACAIARFQPRRLVALALAGSLAYMVVPTVLLVRYRLDGRPETIGFWRPALTFLDRHARPGFRVEVVPTASHWEAYWIPRSGFALARGWYRQIDVAENAVLYSAALDGPSYAQWLRATAVEYVLLAGTKLDPVGGPKEAALLRSNTVPGLEVVRRTGAWTIYRLRRPTPLITGPGTVTIDRFDHTHIAGTSDAAGRFLLRGHYLGSWDTTPGTCVAAAPNGMTLLILAHPGRFALEAPGVGSSIARAIDGASPCPKPRTS